MEALELCPENPELLTTVGLLFLKLGNNTKAFEFLGNSLTYDPKSAKTILAAGSIIQDNQVRDGAWPFCVHYLVQEQLNSCSLLYWLSLVPHTYNS